MEGGEGEQRTKTGGVELGARSDDDGIEMEVDGRGLSTGVAAERGRIGAVDNQDLLLAEKDAVVPDGAGGVAVGGVDGEDGGRADAAAEQVTGALIVDEVGVASHGSIAHQIAVATLDTLHRQVLAGMVDHYVTPTGSLMVDTPHI